MKDERAIIWAILGIQVVAAGVVGIFTIRPSLCTADVFTHALHEHEATWCWEFWLNRYQTLAAAMLAFIVAAGTGGFIYLQWVEARRQGTYYRLLLLEEARTGVTALITSAEQFYSEAWNAKNGLITLLRDKTFFENALVATTSNHLVFALDAKAAFKAALTNPRVVSPWPEARDFIDATDDLLSICQTHFPPGRPVDLLLGQPEEQLRMIEIIQSSATKFDFRYHLLIRRMMREERVITQSIRSAEREFDVRPQ